MIITDNNTLRGVLETYEREVKNINDWENAAPAFILEADLDIVKEIASAAREALRENIIYKLRDSTPIPQEDCFSSLVRKVGNAAQEMDNDRQREDIWIRFNADEVSELWKLIFKVADEKRETEKSVTF